MGELIEYKPKVESVGAQRLETSALGLTFSVKPKYVMVGLKLECTASIGSVYWQSFQETPKVSQKEQPAISGNWGIFSSAAGISSNYLSKCNPIVFCLFFSFQLIIHSPGYFRHFVCFPRYGFTPFSR